jgi:hypothetical protein
MKRWGEEGEWDEWEEEGVRKKGEPRFLFSPIRPILPLLPVLALKKSRAMLRCQINRLKKKDPEEPHKLQMKSIIKLISQEKE